MSSITVTLDFEPTQEGLTEARSELDRFAASLWGDGTTMSGGSRGEAPSADPQGPDPAESPAVTVYRNAGYGGQSRRCLEVLPGDESSALTPTEIGKLLKPRDDGTPREPAHVRAVLRNIKRNEHTRKVRGEMPEDREIVLADWSNYDREGCGRYYLSKEDREAIDRHRGEHS